MFTVYSKPQCSACDQAKALLKAQGAEFKVITLDVGQPKADGEDYITREKLLAKFPTARTMPQIIRETENSAMYVGGYLELRSLMHIV